MANFVFNVAKGRVAEFYHRVKNNDPAAAVLRVIALNVTSPQDPAMIDADTVTALLALTDVAEVTNTGYTAGGEILTDTDLSVLTPNDTDDRMDLDTGDITFSAISATPGWTDLVYVYDPLGTYADKDQCIPLTCHDFAVTPDGSDIIAQVADFYRAS